MQTLITVIKAVARLKRGQKKQHRGDVYIVFLHSLLFLETHKSRR